MEESFPRIKSETWSTSKATSSEMRMPDENSVSMIARSRKPSGLAVSGSFSMLSISCSSRKEIVSSLFCFANARSKAWYEANHEERCEAIKRWQAENPEKVREQHKSWRAANLEKARASSKRWAAANREKKREY